jgi:inosine/xanthosine triphosphatase
MKVAVGTTNPNKVDAVREVFSSYFDAEVVSVEVPSSVTNQPMDEDTIIEGCINRAQAARKAAKADVGVGIEAGVRPAERAISGYVAVTWCAIADGESVFLGSGPQFEWPRKFIDEIKGGRELKHVAEGFSGEKGIGAKGGLISAVTRGKVVRKDLNTWAVRSAIIPLVSKQLYFGD